MSSELPPETIIKPTRRLWLFFLLGLIGVFGLTLVLPVDRYVQMQELDETIHFRMRWIYERIHFDETPIDIAIIGNSRLRSGVDTPALEALLNQRLDRPVNVVNLSTPQEGRNTHWVIARDLLREHPEVSMIMLSAVEAQPRMSHPAFRDLGTAMDVLGSPLLINRDYVADIAYLPVRQLRLFVKSVLPDLFGHQSQFDEAAYWGSAYFTTGPRPGADGPRLPPDFTPRKEVLAEDATKRLKGLTPPVLPERLADWEFAIERRYNKKIQSRSAAADAALTFLYLPIYSDTGGLRASDYYEQLGTVFAADHLAGQAEIFSDYGHLNTAGRARVAPWLAEQIANAINAGTITLKDR